MITTPEERAVRRAWKTKNTISLSAKREGPELGYWSYPEEDVREFIKDEIEDAEDLFRGEVPDILLDTFLKVFKEKAGDKLTK